MWGKEGHRRKGRGRERCGRGGIGGRNMGGTWEEGMWEGRKRTKEKLRDYVIITNHIFMWRLSATPSFGTIPGIACASQTSPANQEIHHTNNCG